MVSNCWDILLCQQMLDATKRIADNNFVFRQDSAWAHFTFSTVQLMQCMFDCFYLL